VKKEALKSHFREEDDELDGSVWDECDPFMYTCGIHVDGCFGEEWCCEEFHL
jgi:hypothetical protein